MLSYDLNIYFLQEKFLINSELKHQVDSIYNDVTDKEPLILFAEKNRFLFQEMV